MLHQVQELNIYKLLVLHLCLYTQTSDSPPPRRVATSLNGLIHDKSIWSDHVTAVTD